MSRLALARGRRQLLFTAILFSTGGAAVKALHLPAAQIAGLRSLIAAIALFALAPQTRRRHTWQTASLAVVYALVLVTFVLATRFTTSANAIFLQDAAPLYILFLSLMFLRERPSRLDLLFMAPIGIGLALCVSASQPALATAPNPTLGNIFGAISGVAYAVVIVGFRALSRGGDSDASIAVTALGNLFAFLITLPFALPCAAPRATDIALLLYLGVFQIGLAYALMTRAMRWVPALEASLLLLLEPVLNPVWTWLVHRERPAMATLAGGALILMATAARASIGPGRARAAAQS